jgi:ABC-2 type transport system permease protein
VLATAVGRVRWAASHVLVAVGGAAAMLLLAGLFAGVSDAAVGGVEGVGTLIGAGLAQLPAALAVAGFVVLAFGGLPRAVTTLAWAALVLSIAAGLFGDLFGLPRWARRVAVQSRPGHPGRGRPGRTDHRAGRRRRGADRGRVGAVPPP